MAKYRLAPKARDDMEAVWLYSLTEWGVKQTDHYIDTLTDAFSLLANNSGAGTVCNHIRKGYRRYPVKRHMIYYLETSYGIKVMRVLHNRRLVERHF